MKYLHKASLSPDPTCGQKVRTCGGNRVTKTIYPHVLVDCSDAKTSLWGRMLHLHRKPVSVELRPDAAGRISLVLDFGTELDGVLELSIEARRPGVALACFGESREEAEEWGICNRSPWHIVPKEKWDYVAGRRRHRFVQRGFRFIKLQFFDVKDRLTLCGLSVDASFTFEKQQGEFQCSDTLFQEVWQASVYTARLCARPDDIWDGIKRDRWGWFGDARIGKETLDAAFFSPGPSESMLLRMDTDKWANGIPNYSFDGIAMFKQHLLAFGLDRPCIPEVYKRIKALLSWCEKTQTDSHGLLTRRNETDYFFKVGFCDWSPLPDGGRFEELSWLQCAYAEALQDAALIAGWLGKKADAARYAEQAARLRTVIRKRFWNPRKGFEHTLNICEPENRWGKERHGGAPHYQGTYVDGKKLGPSGPSRQANARAVWAGVCDDAMKRVMLNKVFRNANVPPIITTFYKYYEQMARAACGDAAGALLEMRNYMGCMVRDHDSSTIWEWFEPEVKGVRALDLGNNPAKNDDIVIAKSLCHIWGSGTVGLAQQYLLGLEPVAPGFAKIRMHPSAVLPWTFEAAVPTPHGILKIWKDKPDGPVEYQTPKGIQIANAI